MKMQAKPGEVMWPSLVANKILNKRLGSNNFIADFQNSSETLLETSSSNQPSDAYKLFVGSWNVGGIAPPDDLNLEDWINIGKDNNVDIYVLGFQEIVPLSAGNVLGSENGRISMQWNSVIRAALNRTVPTQRVEVGEFQKVYPLKKHNPTSDAPMDFQCIISKQMVGIFISVWARSNLTLYITHPSVSCVGCGIMGCLGNKGSVSVRFCLHETSFCFVCSHLASGGKEGDEKQRNADATEILSRTTFPRGPLHDLPRKILDHDRVIWLGDLNYRIYLSEDTTRSLVNEGQWTILLQNDQLKAEFEDGHTFGGWQEEVIDFAPTYKYYPNSDDYFGCNRNGKGKKRRTPAWCDRIIWFGKGLKQQQYSRGECRMSDHRPVRAIFTAEIKVLRSSKPSDQSLLSNKFNHSSNLCISNKFLCNGLSSFPVWEQT